MKPTVKSEMILCKLQTHPLRVRFFVGAEKSLRKGLRCSEVRASAVRKRIFISSSRLVGRAACRQALRSLSKNIAMIKILRD